MTALDEMHDTFTRWLGRDYDLDAIDATVAAAAAIRLGGDPVWLLLVGGPGNAKTETVSALGGSGAHVVSTIASEGALLSGTSKGERTSDATGGLLHTIGSVGVLVLKDFTSILSLPQSTRPGVLAGLREAYDGRWTRTIGADGGRTLEWTGRLCTIGAVTTAWDQAHTTVSAMGDRFVLLRMDSMENRLAGGRQAIANTGHEQEMREDLSAAVTAVLEQADTTGVELNDHAKSRLLAAANLVTLARTAVMRDGRGNVIDAHAPEMPTRFAKQLAQLVRGGVAIGMDVDEAIGLAIRCARDSMPPLRLAILVDLMDNPRSHVADVRKRIQRPRNTVDRDLQALHMLGLVVLDEQQDGTGLYSIGPATSPSAVFPEIEVPPFPKIGGLLLKLDTLTVGLLLYLDTAHRSMAFGSARPPAVRTWPTCVDCVCTATRFATPSTAKPRAEKRPTPFGRSGS